MKLGKYSKKQGALATIGLVILGVSVNMQLEAQSFGINFLGNTSDNVTGSAGVVPISLWNNVASSYTSGSVLANDGSTTATLTLSGALPGDGGWHSGSTADGGNGSLMDGYLDLGANNGGSGTLTMSGLTGSLYNVYVYIYSDGSHPGNNGDYLPNYAINGTTYYAPQLGNGITTYDATSTAVGGVFTGFVQATTYAANFNTQTANASDFGNYIKVGNVAPIAGVITITGEANTQSWRSPMDGIELVPQVVPEPTTMALSVSGLALIGLIRRRNK